MRTLQHLIALALLLQSATLTATHLVGGELSYECIGNNNYVIRMIIYRDCAALGGAPFDNPATISVYDGNNTLVHNLKVFRQSTGNLPVVAPNNCTSLPQFVCTEKAHYIDTVNLPPDPNGYVISHQRCCRNHSISNIPAPGSWGNTYTVEVPPNDNSCNSSPQFNTPPPVALCVNIPVELDLSASESDGDSLSYSFCNMLHGGGQSNTPGPNSPSPDPAEPPPYQPVPFGNGFSATNPITSNPPFTIDHETGIITGRPTQVGQFVFAICVEEYRNGQLLSTVMRDFQFNVTGMCTGAAAFIEGQTVDPSTLCTGKTITFNEDCVNATSYFWDFGDPNSNQDTSSQQQPTYTYSDTGVYTVMLVANPNSACSDTTYSTYRVFDPINVSFNFNADPCFDVHELNFDVSGTFSHQAEFQWDFGGNTNLGRTSSMNQPRGVRYNQPGSYEVRLEVNDFECISTYTDSVFLYPRPVLSHSIPQRQECVPVMVEFNDSSTHYGRASHYWSFGDGAVSNQASPTHIYEDEGLYTISHTLITLEGCRDTLSETFRQRIRVFPRPRAALSTSPSTTSIYDPDINITIQTEGAIKTHTLFPDGRQLEDMENYIYTAQDTGWLTFRHVAINEFGCADTGISEVYVEEPINFFLPNAFTPNSDGRNDEFSFVVTGSKDFVLEIFNRWGELVYRSRNDQENWNGRIHNTGEKVPGGVYSYVLKALVEKEGREETIRGTITVIR